MEVIVRLLPIALAVAISSVPITTTIFILLSPNRTRSGVAFLIGWTTGIALMITLFTLFARAVPTPRSTREPDVAVGVIEIVAGAALIVLEIIGLIRSRGRTPEAPKWVTAAAKLGPWSSLGLGLIMNVRPKGIFLAVAAGVTVHADAASVPVAVVAIVIYTVVGASTVATPIIAMLAVPAVFEPRLLRINAWMIRRGSTLTRVIIAILGAVIIGMGIARL